jgi:hypothetical protein
LDGLRHEGVQTFLGARVALHVKPVLVERFLQGLDLRARHLDLGLAHLGEVARGHIPGEQADDHDDDEQLEQREAFHRSLDGHCQCAPKEMFLM